MLNPLNAAGSVLKGLSLGKRVGGGALGTYNYLAILKSRSVLDSVVPDVRPDRGVRRR